jgi:hypothetical protein
MAKHVSEVEDGFALKRQRENTKPGKKRNVKDGCTIPPPPVKHAERVTSERVVGRDYDCWDVHTNKDRYWVILRQSPKTGQ